MIELKKIEKKYMYDNNEESILNNIDLKIEKGEFIIIIGPSGAGKSTLLHILGLLSRPSEGEYLLDGDSLFEKGEKKIAQLRNQYIGHVFQDFKLIPRLNAIENVEVPLVYSGNNKIKKRRELCKKALDKVGLNDKYYLFNNQLSGGQKQRVAIARAIINNPDLIIADEPTGALDSGNSINIMNIFMGLHQQGKTIILVTHDQSLCNYATRIIHISDGKILSDKKVAK